MQTVSNVPQKPYYKVEFEEFIKNIGNINIGNWSIMAETLGVSRKTISRWKQHPLARQAILKAVQNALSQMEKAGENDWRMWREQLKMLGVGNNNSAREGEASNKSIPNLLGNIERTNYEELIEISRRDREVKNVKLA